MCGYRIQCDDDTQTYIPHVSMAYIERKCEKHVKENYIKNQSTVTLLRQKAARIIKNLYKKKEEKFTSTSTKRYIVILKVSFYRVVQGFLLYHLLLFSRFHINIKYNIVLLRQSKQLVPMCEQKAVVQQKSFLSNIFYYYYYGY